MGLLPPQAVRSVSVCRVLIVNRAAYGSLERSFPAASRQVLQNLVEKADLVRRLLPGCA